MLCASAEEISGREQSYSKACRHSITLQSRQGPTILDGWRRLLCVVWAMNNSIQWVALTAAASMMDSLMGVALFELLWAFVLFYF